MIENLDVWYVYQDNKQSGPYEVDELKSLMLEQKIQNESFVYKVGWKDWLPVADVLPQLGLAELQSEPTEDRRGLAPRATVNGRVIVHNNGQMIIGSGINISASGIFVETPDRIFEIGEEIRLTCRIDGLLDAFNTQAVVVRYNDDPRYARGYGIRFLALDFHVKNSIQALVDQENSALENQQPLGA